MKKCFVLFLVLTLVLSLVSCGEKKDKETGSKSVTEGNIPVDENGNPSPFGRYKEPITIRIAQEVNASDVIPEGQTATDNQYTRYVKEKMNIDIDVVWQAASGNDFLQKVNMSIAASDLPDILVVGEAQYRSIIKSGLAQDLTESYNVYASDTIKSMIDKTEGKALAAVTDDGKMMALPGVQVEMDGYNLLWIRQDWLDKLNLEAPKTVEDIYNVGKAFVDNKMGGENTIGLLGPTSGNILYHNFLNSANGTYTFDGIFAAYKAYPGIWMKDKEEKAVYGTLTEETKTALGMLAKMYKDGILDQELGTRKDAGEAFKSGQAGMFFGPWWMGYGGIKDAVVNDPNASWVAYASPLTDEGTWEPRLGASTIQYTIVNKEFDHPEAAILLTNYLVRDEKDMDTTKLGVSYYPARTVLAALDECTYSVEVIREYLKTGKTPEYDNKLYKLLDADVASVKETKLEPYDDMRIEYWDPSNDNFARMMSLLNGSGCVVDALKNLKVNKVYSLIYSQTETMEKKWTNLKKMEDEIILKIILGTASIDEFDKFVTEWKKQGGDQITEEVQATLK
ncbi:MAG: transporter substrate-binding protein [Anaerocolumna sp.]|nr:transporter substrate-binding protein [Anaerocolumna sp.]